MVEGVQWDWDLTEGGVRNVLDFLASIRVAQFAPIEPHSHPWCDLEIIGAFADRGLRL